jgi:NAD(P)-dependent dehydrogenase (short-subunit alcohol dehydrogenase family)
MKRMHTYIVTGGNTGLGYQCARFLGADPNTLDFRSSGNGRSQSHCPSCGRLSCRILRIGKESGENHESIATRVIWRVSPPARLVGRPHQRRTKDGSRLQ